MAVSVTNEQDFIDLYDDYYDKIYNYLRKSVASREAAEDLTSTAFLNALNFIKKKKTVIYNFPAWIYRIATNELIKYLKINKRQKTVSLHSGENPIEQTLKNGRSEFEKKLTDFFTVKKAIGKLPPQEAVLIQLHFFEGKNYAEIAEMFNFKETTLRSKIHRSLKKLSAYVEAPGEGSGK